MRIARPLRSSLLIGTTLAVSVLLGPLTVPVSAQDGAASAATSPAPADVVIFDKTAPNPAATAPPSDTAAPQPTPAAATEATPVQAAKPVEDSIGVLVTRRAMALAGRNAAKDDLAGLTAYYAANPDKPLWIGDTALTQRARAAIAEIRRADEWGLDAREFVLPGKSAAGDRAELIEAEARLTLAVLKYARHARGGRLDPTQLSPSIDRRAQLRDARLILDDIAATEAADAYLRRQHPPHQQFEKLRRLYNDLRAGKTPPSADVAQAPPEPPQDIERGRRRNPQQAAPAPEPVNARRVLLNMEQWRWMPRDLGKLYVTVNIPEYTLRVVKAGQAIHTERVVVGEVDKQTPIFSENMQSVVFHPGWGVPNSIKTNELLPGLLRGRDTLSRHGLQVVYRGRPVDPLSVDWRTTDIRKLDVVQPPGPSNVLGVVKFQFPNKHDVYMHDTPTKNLFNAEARAFSHGCIRVRNPLRLAEIVFAEDQGWTPDRVTSLVRGGPQDNKVMLAHKIPVHITSFTVVLDETDKPRVYRDIYGFEDRIEMGLAGKTHLIPKPREETAQVRTAAVGRLAEPRASYRASGRVVEQRPAPRGGDWVRGVFSGF